MKNLPKAISIKVTNAGKKIVFVCDVLPQNVSNLKPITEYLETLKAVDLNDYKIDRKSEMLTIMNNVGVFQKGEYYNIEIKIDANNRNIITLYQEK